jgi:hypothetical protein
MKPLIKLLFFLILFHIASAVKGQDLYFAGFSFIGAATENENYPVAISIYKANSSLLNQQLSESLRKLKRTDLNLIRDSGSIKSGNAVALAYGLQKETLAEYQVEGGYQTKFEIIGAIYVFDFSDSEHKLITNIPTQISITVPSPNKLSGQEVRGYFENLYLPGKNIVPYKIIRIDDDSGVAIPSVFDDWVNRLETASIERAKSYNKLQIRNIDIDPVVQSQLTNSKYIKDIRSLKNETARNFESYLSKYQKVPLLPYAIGQAIGSSTNGMVARFNDTNFDIKIPPPDFAVDILIREFKKTFVDNKVYDGYIYGAFVTLKIVRAGFNDVKEEVKSEFKFSNKFEIQVPKSYKLKIEDDWPSWMGSQKKLFQNISEQISIKDEQFLSDKTNTPNIKEQLKSFEDIISKCK